MATLSPPNSLLKPPVSHVFFEVPCECAASAHMQAQQMLPLLG